MSTNRWIQVQRNLSYTLQVIANGWVNSTAGGYITPQKGGGSLMPKNKKLSRKEQEDTILEKVYDLILDEQTQDDERAMLVTFKNDIGKGIDFERKVMYLAEGLRQLAVKRLTLQSKLSPRVGEFYMEISSTGLLTRSLGNGLAAMGQIF
ncbi:MAG: bacteriocin immunity protein [Sporolactobacillus sp.]